MVEKTCQSLESLNSNVRPRSQAQFTILGQNEQDTDVKYHTSTNSASELTNPLKMEKKTFQAFESLKFDVCSRSQTQITILGQDEQKTYAKKWSLRNSASELPNPLEMVKNTCQSLESLNSDVRARSQAQITILGQNEQETDAKNQTSTNSASELTNPLEMVNKTFQAFESLNSDVRARSQAQITILGQYKQEKDAKKNGVQGIRLLSP